MNTIGNINNDELRQLGARLFLSSVDFVGNITIYKLLERYKGGAEEIWRLKDEEIRNSELLQERQKAYFINKRKEWDLENRAMHFLKHKIKTVTLEDDNYPSRLRNIPDAPYLLYYQGELPQEEIPCVSIIGARMCSEYGKGMAKEFADGLAKKGVQIISGLASGIDGISQRAALDAKGKSFGILGCGVDVCYPAGNRKLYEDLKEQGGLISEFEPGTAPEAYHFPRRNRIISGLSDIILVVEAKEKSGTAITVTMGWNRVEKFMQFLAET